MFFSNFGQADRHFSLVIIERIYISIVYVNMYFKYTHTHLEEANIPHTIGKLEVVGDRKDVLKH